MNRSTILLFGVSAQVILAIVFMTRAVGDIQADLRTQSETALAARNISWASIEISGRDVTLSGLAPNEKLRQRALDTLAAIVGIRRIDDQLSIIARPEFDSPAAQEPALSVETLVEEMDSAQVSIDFAGPYEFRVTREGTLATVSGLAPDIDAKESLVALARQAFGGARVIDRVEINNDAPPGFLFAATQALSIAELITEGSVGVRGSEIFVEGVTSNDRDLARIREVIDSATPEGFTSSMQLGSRQELESLLRQNPDLADRVGPLPSRPATVTSAPDPGHPVPDIATAALDTPVESVSPAPVARTIDRGPRAAMRCQTRFEELLAEEKIAFATGRSDIDGSSSALLDRLVEAAKTCPGTRIEIAGHTDDQGRESKNLLLSQERAESVMAYMVRQGVDLGRLSAVGYGENQPLVPNRTIVDRATNRRIEFKISQ